MTRAVPPLLNHTFQDTGMTVQLRKLSPFLQDDVTTTLRKADRAAGTYPMPPIVAGVEGKLEANDSDPDYQKAAYKYEVELRPRVQEKLMSLAIVRGIVFEFGEPEQAMVKELRQQMSDLGIVTETDVSDRELYITRICCGSKEDIRELYDAMFKRTVPTSAEVDDQKATFPDNSSG